MSTEFDTVANEFKEFNSQMQNPLVVGALLHKLTQERQSTNLLFKNLLEKIESLESKVASMEAKLSTPTVAKPKASATLLSQTDEKIVDYITTHEKACAEELQKEFGYKGRNAASSRLNALFKQGKLEKAYAGKTVYFMVKSKTE